MSKLYLLKYRIKNNDIELINNIKILIFLFCIIILSTLFYFFKPFELLRAVLEENKEEYVALKDIKKEEKNEQNTNYILPIAGTITSGYGYRQDPFSGNNSWHSGIDISGIHHDNVRCIDNGIVTFAGSQSGYGNCVEVKHNNYYSFYAHLSKINVAVNQNISIGDIIGIEGGDPASDPNPGYSTGHHLHFEIRSSSGYGNDINPINYINKKL